MTSKLSSHPNDSISTGEEKLQMELLTTVEASKMVPQFNLEKCVNEYATRPSDEHWRKADRWEVAEYRRTHWSRSAMQLRTIISKGEVTAYKKRGRWYIVPRSLKRWIQRHEVREVFEREIIEGFEQAYYELSYSDVNI